MAKYITECKLNYFNSKKAGKIAIVTMDNGQPYNIPNTWGTRGSRVPEQGPGHRGKG